MKSYSRFLLFVTFVVSMLLFVAQPALAQAEESAETPIVEEDGYTIMFDELGFKGAALQSPVDSTRIFLRTPSSWQITADSTINLNIVTFVAQGGIVPNGDVYGGLLDIRVNGINVSTTLVSRSGEQTISFNVPTSAIEANPGTLQLTATLRTERNRCNDGSGSFSTVLVEPTSNFQLQHETIIPELNVAALPKPIQQASFLPDVASIVVPNNATAGELSAAMTVAAGMGRKTWQLQMDLIMEEAIDEAIQDSRHFIFVGAQERFSLLNAIALPAAQFSDEVSASDGLLQLRLSPFSSEFVMLHVGGSSDEAVQKAAQALGSAAIRTTENPQLAIVTEVSEEEDLPAQAIEQSLGDYGYDLIRFEGEGFDSVSFEFFVPAGKTVADSEEVKATFELLFNHAATIDYERSSINVIVNDEPVGSFRLDANSTVFTSKQVIIPASSIRTGINEIAIATEMFSATGCNLFSRVGAWTVVHPDSGLNLPLVDVTVEPTTAILLDDFPNPFVSGDNLSNTTFILPTDESAAWNIAAQIGMMLGDNVGANVLNLTAVFADDVATVDKDQQLLIIGEPMRLTLMEELNASLPAPFAPNSNRVAEEPLQITYLVAEDSSLGYLQLSASPWHEGQTVVSIFGTDADGLQSAADSLLNGNRRRQLNGDFAVIYNEQIFSAMVNSPFTNQEETASEGDEEAAAPVEEVIETAVIEETATDAVEETVVFDSVETEEVAELAEEETVEAAAPALNVSEMVSAAISPQVANAAQANAPQRASPTALGFLIFAAIVAGVLVLFRLRKTAQSG